MSHENDNLILDIENLVVRYETEDGIVHALNGIDLQLGYHQTIGLVGETGAGKTTAALAMMRLVPSPPGVVECDKLMVDGTRHSESADGQDGRGPRQGRLDDFPGPDDGPEPSLHRR